MMQSDTCVKCGRELRIWPLKRGRVCAPRDWVYCIRPQDGAA